MRKLMIVSGLYTHTGEVNTPRRPLRLGQIICDGELIASLRERQAVALAIDDGRHIIQCVEERPRDPGRTVSDVVRVPPGQEGVRLRLQWGEQTLYLTAD